ncbi:MAG: phosphate butyryltransferase [candidate division Zixibacteria bacterium]|nr:phosphate butyryltransferase [candidate division Zixibacteria bacterium]
MADPIRNLDDLQVRLRQMVAAKGKVRAAIVGADDAVTMEAISRAKGEGLIEVTLIGPGDTVRQQLERSVLSSDQVALIASETPERAAVEAAALASGGGADILVRGKIAARELLQGLFKAEAGFRRGKAIVSHVAVFDHDNYPRLLLLSDAAVNVEPDLARKLAIIDNAVTVANRLSVTIPKVALLAAVEVIYPAMPVTMEAAVIAKMADKGQIKNCRIDGPLSMDVAVLPEVARQKGAVSAVAGEANILIAPNIETAAGVYKGMALFSGAKIAGAVIGGKVPIAFPSRCDSARNIFHALTLAAFLSLSGR